MRVRYRYASYTLETECDLDVKTRSLSSFTPNFDINESYNLPCECFLDVTMDGLNYLSSEMTFLIYAGDLTLKNAHPKCASVVGGTELHLYCAID